MSQIENRLFETFRAEIRELCLEHVRGGAAALWQNLEKFHKALAPLAELHASGKNEDTRRQSEIWLEALRQLEAAIHETCGLLIEQGAPQPPDVLDIHFGGILEEIPAQHSEDYTSALFSARPDDDSYVRLRRFLLRRRIGWHALWHKKAVLQRSFETSPFIKFHLQRPVLEALWEYRQYLLQKTAQLLQHVENDWAMALTHSGLLPDENGNGGEADMATDLEPLRRQVQGFEELLREAEEDLGANIEKVFDEAREKWQKAASFAWPGRRFGRRRVYRRQILLQKMRTRYAQKWQEYWQAILGDWQTNLRLGFVTCNVASQWCVLRDSLDSIFTKNLYPPFEAVRNDLQQSLDDFNENMAQSKTDLRQQIVRRGREITRHLRRQHLPPLLDTINNSNPAKPLEEFEQILKHIPEEIPEKEIILKSEDLTMVPPRFETETINLRDLTENDVFIPALRRLTQVKKSVSELSQKLSREISEVDQVVDFNFESALAMLQKTRAKDDAVGKAAEICIEGLERAVGKVEDLSQLLERSAGETATAGKESAREIISRLLNLVDNAQIIDLKLRLVRARARERVREISRNSWTYFKRLLPLGLRYVRKGWKWLYGRYAEFRKLAGLETHARRVSEEATAFLLDTEDKIRSLPFVYQRLFRLEQTADSRFFAAREKEIRALAGGLEIWEKGQFACISIVGEKGSGKTSLLENSVAEVFEGYKLYNLVLDESLIDEKLFSDWLSKQLKLEKGAHSLEQLEEIIERWEQPRIVLLENIHHLFLRTTDGFDLLERFLLFISNTNPHIFWIASCSKYAWQYLDKLLNISDYFRHVVHLGDLPRRQIEEMIMKRHITSGYRLTLEVPEKMERKSEFRKLKSEEEKQSYLRDYFFDQLSDIAEGNISIALMLWQRSIVRFDDEEVIIDPDLDLDYTFLGQLPADKMFTLAAIMQHGAITEKQHAAIFRSNLQSSTLMLKSMADDGILIRADGRYDVHHYLYRHVVRQLKSLNFIH